MPSSPLPGRRARKTRRSKPYFHQSADRSRTEFPFRPVFLRHFPARWGRNAFHAPPFSPKWGRIEDEKNGNTKKEEYLYAQNDYYSRKSGLLYGLIHFFCGKIGFQTGYRAVTFGWMHKNSRKKIQTHFEFPYMEINGHFLGVFEGFSLV